MRRIGLKNCPYCGASEVYVSAPKTFWERVPAVFLLGLVRCHRCMRRHYRPMLLPTAGTPATSLRKPPDAVSAKKQTKRPA
jgi:hypothetical protein